MAKKELGVGVKIDGDAKGFKSAAEDAKKATAALKRRQHRTPERWRGNLSR